MSSKLGLLQRVCALLQKLFPSEKKPLIDPFELPYLKQRFERNMTFLPDKIIYAWRSEFVPQNAAEKKRLKQLADAGEKMPDEISLRFRLNLSELDFHLTLAMPEATPFSEASKMISSRATDTLANKLARLERKKKNTIDAYESKEVYTRKLQMHSELNQGTLKDVLLSERSLYLDAELDEKIPYSIYWLQFPMDSVVIPSLPRENLPLTALIDTKKGAKDRLYEDMQPRLTSCAERMRVFWFTSKSQGMIRPQDIEWIDGRPQLPKAEFRCEAHTFTPTAEDVGKYVCVAIVPLPTVTQEGEGDYRSAAPAWTTVARSEAVVLAEQESGRLLAAEKMLWAQRDSEEQSKDEDKSRTRIVSYNLLSDTYINLSLKDLFYPYVDKKYQHTRYRYALALKELQAYAADLYFLQEVCPRMGYHYLPSLFRDSGHGFEFQRKYAEVREGSGIAWNLARYGKQASWSRWLSDALEEDYNEDIRTLLARAAPEDRAFFAGRPTLVHIVHLTDTFTGSELLLGNTHLHHDPRHEHIKALQTALVARELAQRLLALSAPGADIRVALGADLNSTPYSAAVALLRSGRVAANDPVWNADLLMGGMELRLPQELEGLVNLGGEPETTNYTVHKDEEGKDSGFSGCIDYVWAKGFETIAVAPQPSLKEISAHTALPSPVAPSDHLALVMSARHAK